MYNNVKKYTLVMISSIQTANIRHLNTPMQLKCLDKSNLMSM